MWLRTLGNVKFCDDPLLDGDIDELVYPTQASFEVSDLITSGSEVASVTEESA
jgi:hypothetical protein